MNMNPATGPAGQPTFPLFGRLPPELQRMIWEAALPGPRIVYLKAEYTYMDWESRYMKRKRFRVLRDLDRELGMDDDDDDDDDDDEGHEGRINFKKHDERKFATRSPMYAKNSALNPFKFTSPSTRTLLPLIRPLLICTYGSYRAALRHYTKTFSSPFHPGETWFSYKDDTLYLDWGCVPGGNLADKDFTPEDFNPSEAYKVRNLALNDGYDMQGPIVKQSPQFERMRYMRWLHRNVLPVFQRLKSLGLVNKQHRDTLEELTDLVSTQNVYDVYETLSLFMSDNAQRRHAQRLRLVKEANDSLAQRVCDNAPVWLTRDGVLEPESHRRLGHRAKYAIPECEYVTFMTQERLVHLIVARWYFEWLKVSWESDVWIRFLGSNLRPIRVTVQSHVTVRAIINAFRYRMGIPEALRLYSTQWERVMDVTLYDMEFERGEHGVMSLVVNDLEPAIPFMPDEHMLDGIFFWCNCDMCISSLGFGDWFLAVTYNLFGNSIWPSRL